MLPNWRDPVVFALLVALFVALVALGITAWNTHTLNAELAASMLETEQVKADRAAVQAQRDDARRENEAFARMVQEQGAAIVELQSAAEQRQAKAGAAARAVLKEPLRLPSGHGPKEMNAWLRASVSSP